MVLFLFLLLKSTRKKNEKNPKRSEVKKSTEKQKQMQSTQNEKNVLVLFFLCQLNISEEQQKIYSTRCYNTKLNRDTVKKKNRDSNLNAVLYYKRKTE